MSLHVLLTELSGWLAQPPLIPDPPPVAPPGPLSAAADWILGVMKWGGFIGAVGALIAAGIMMIVGRRNRNSMAIEGAISVPWVACGLAMVLGAASVVAVFVQ